MILKILSKLTFNIICKNFRIIKIFLKKYLIFKLSYKSYLLILIIIFILSLLKTDIVNKKRVVKSNFITTSNFSSIKVVYILQIKIITIYI